MAGYVQENVFTGGMNQDVVNELLPDNDWRYALNCRNGNSEKDAVGSIENHQGNELLTFTLPSGQNRCIGAGADKRSSIFYFVWNQFGNHCILRYRIDSNVIEKVLYPTGPVTPPNRVIDTRFLNFQNNPRYRIYSLDIIVGNDDTETMYWTDGWVERIETPYDKNLPPLQWNLKPYNPPRKLNITLATNLCNNITPRYPYDLGDGGETQAGVRIGDLAVQNQYTDRANHTPMESMDLEFRSDDTRNTNYFRGKSLPQFRYRYRFIDDSFSVWSPISRVQLPELDETPLGINTFNTFKNNYVNMDIPTGHGSVTQIELAVRFGNFGNWFTFELIQKYDDSRPQDFPLNELIPSNTRLQVRFYNDKILRAIAEPELIGQSLVPIVSASHTLVQNNRLIDANIIEGYDAVDLGETDSVVTIEPVTLSQITNPDFTAVLNLDPNTIDMYDFYFPYDYTTVKEGTVISFTLRNFVGLSGFGEYRTFSYVVTPQSVSSQAAWIAFVANITDEMFVFSNGLFPWLNNVPVVTFSGVSYFFIDARATTPIDPTQIEYTQAFNLTAVNQIEKRPSFKLGAWHKLAIIYYDDAGRYGGANSSDSLNVYIPFLTESAFRSTNYGITDSAWVSKINVRIKNLAPTWARKYMIAYAGSDISYFVQLPIAGTPTVATNGGTQFNLNSLLALFVDDNKPTPVQYVYEDGDRMRFITNTNGIILDQYVDVRIRSVALSGSDWIAETDGIQFQNLEIGDGSIVEIYRKRAEGSDIVYEFGDIYDVNYSSANNVSYHESPIQNQDPANPVTTPAILELTRGDVYVKRRGYKNTAGVAIQWPYGIEAQQWSDFYPSSDIDIGRANVILPTAKQQRLPNALRHSDVYFEQTGINGLSTVRANSFTTLPLVYGAICRVVEVGFTVKAVQASKTSSIYIGRLQTFKADGSPDLIATDQVFGTKLIPETDYGSTWPGSVCKHDRHVYFFDSMRGCVVRDAPNGQVEVSKYGMNNPFRELGDIITKYQRSQPSGIDIVSVFDERLGYYILTILRLSNEITDLDSQSVCFHEDSNRWKEYISHIPEMWGQRGINTISFQNGSLWVRSDDEVNQNTFFGVFTPSKIRVVHNSEPNTVKVMDNVTIHATSLWQGSDDNGSLNINIPANDQYPSGMASRLLPNKFKAREGKWHAAFMRDANTPMTGSLEEKIVSGRTLRGYVMTAQYECYERKYVRLFSIITNSTPSNLSK